MTTATTTRPSPTARCRGFSLVELMVAITVGLFLLGGLAAIMVSSRKNYEVMDLEAGIQENARFALHFLARDLRMAGYFGCSDELVSAVNPLEGADAGIGGADTMTVRYADPADDGITAAEHIPEEGGTITVSALGADWPTSGSFQVVLSDCEGAAIGTVTAVDTDNGTITLSGGLGRTFEAGDAVRQLRANTYTVDTTGGVPVLRRNGQELVRGVENMQILYRTASGQQADVPAWSELQGVNVGLVVRSISNYRPGTNATGEFGTNNEKDAGTHVVLDQDVSAALDSTLRVTRRVFEQAIMVRNSS